MRRQLFLAGFWSVVILTGAQAQDKSVLYGRVFDAQRVAAATPDWRVEISCENQDGSPAPERITSQGDLYIYKVPPNVTARLIFSRSGYKLKATEWITISTDKLYGYRILPDIELTPILMARSNTSSTGAPQPAELRLELEEQAGLAQKSHSTDIFHYNLKLYERAFTKNPALTQEIRQFKESATYQTTRPRTEKQQLDFELIGQLPNQLDGGTTQLKAADILRLIEDESLSSSLRGEATRALFTLNLHPAEKERALRYFRAQARQPANAMFYPALISLAKLGNADDTQSLINAVKSSDTQRALASIKAIGEAQFKPGAEAIVQLFRTTNNTTLKIAALQSMLEIQDQASLNAITEAVAGGKEVSVPVRLEAVKALGEWETKDQKARNALVQAQAHDPSPEVKKAAAASLQGNVTKLPVRKNQ